MEAPEDCKSHVALISNKKSKMLDQIKHCNTTICTKMFFAASPSMALKIGIPIMRVFGNTVTENPVMIQPNFPPPPVGCQNLITTANTTAAKIFWRMSERMSLRLIVKGLFWEITWKESKGIENLAMNLLMPTHCSSEKRLRCFVER